MSAAPPAARRPRWPLWLGLALALVAAALLGLWVLLFHTASGRDLVLARVAPMAGLSHGGAEGTLGGGLRLRTLRLESGGTVLTAERLRLDLAPLALWSGEVRVQALQASGVQLRLPPADPGAARQASDPFAATLPAVRLPVALRLDDAELRDLVLLTADGSTLLAARSLALAGRLGQDGALVLSRLAVDSAHGSLSGSGRALLDGGRDLALRLQLHGPGSAGVALLQLDGAGQRLAAVLALPGGDRLALQLTGRDWRLDSALGEVDVASWWPGWEHGPLTLVLNAEGEAATARLSSGTLVLGGERADLGPSVLAYDAPAHRLRLQPLQLTPWYGGTPLGRVSLAGALALDGGPNALRATLQGLRLPGEAGGTLEGSATLTGTVDEYTLQFDGTLLHSDARLPLVLQGHGTRQALVLEQLRVRGPGGEALAGSGRVQWSPAVQLSLDASLEGFDPARLHGDFPGALSGDVQLQATEGEAGGWQATLTLEALSGQVRGRRIRGGGTVHWGAGTGRSDLQLTLGESRIAITGTAGDRLDLLLRLSPLALPDLLPDTAGTLSGQVRVTGTPAAPELALDLEGSALRLAGQQAGTLHVNGHLAAATEHSGALELQAGALRLAGLAFDQLTLVLEGRRGAHRVEARLGGDTSLELLASGALDAGGGWQGTLERLQLALPDQPEWRLRAPAALALREGAFSLAPACLAGPVMTFCANAEGTADTQSADLRLESLPLAALAPLLSAGEPIPLQLSGELSGEARLRRTGEALALDARLALPKGSLAFAATETRELLAWRDLELQASSAGGRLQLELRGVLEESGRIDARLAGGDPWGEEPAAVEGQVTLALPRLRVLELLSPHVADPDGQLQAGLEVSGTWQAPRLQGEVLVQGLSTELPALGIAIKQSRLRARPQADGSLALDGHLDTGEGALALEGRVVHGADGLGAHLELRGERVLASDTPLARALVSPDLSLDYDGSEGLRISGRLGIPEARLDLDQLEGSVSPSPDVVVLDPADPEAGGGGLPVRADLELQLGTQVLLQGLGFDGRVSGTLRVRERPGRVTTARGTLEVTGEYTAYGQDLEVVHGRLLYSATPLDDPSLDVRAEREVRDQTVGLNIRGSARAPELEIVSEPPLEQAEALSYLVLGRPLNAATSAEGGQLSQAAAAIGGNFLAERLGARLGFDTFEVGDSDALGATALTVGKYLSPKLYVSYGMALFEDGRILTLRYILSRRFELELESGAENRVGVNYTLER